MAASEESTVAGRASGATHLDNAALSSVDEHDVVLHTLAVVALTRGRKQNAIFDGGDFQLYHASPVHELKSMHSVV